MSVVYKIIDIILPFSWTNAEFMKNALIAIIIVAPLYGIVGTMVVNKKMAFFADSLGHSALTGIGIGVILGVSNQLISIVTFSLIFAIVLILVKNKSHQATDTTIGVFASTAVALGLVMLSSSGGFQKYSYYLIGDLLSISKTDIIGLLVTFVIIILFWIFIFNKIFIISINAELAHTRGINYLFYDIIFISLIAILVAISIGWVGILVINSLLILPCAAARNFSSNIRQYTLFSILISLVAGIIGLILSFYIGSATGATIILVLAVIYFLSLLIRKR